MFIYGLIKKEYENDDDGDYDFRHALVVFGGLHGLEASLEADPNLDEDDPSLLFQYYINSCPNQGSRTIRTEVGKMWVFPTNELFPHAPSCLLD